MSLPGCQKDGSLSETEPHAVMHAMTAIGLLVRRRLMAVGLKRGAGRYAGLSCLDRPCASDPCAHFSSDRYLPDLGPCGYQPRACRTERRTIYRSIEKISESRKRAQRARQQAARRGRMNGKRTIGEPAQRA